MRIIRVALLTFAVAGAFVAGHVVAVPPPPVEARAVGLSHFLCYAANFNDSDARDVHVLLKDEFADIKAIVSKPEMFCTPVTKKLNGGSARKFSTPADHLTCYVTSGPKVSVEDIGENQIGIVRLRDPQPRLLCVPTYTKR